MEELSLLLASDAPQSLARLLLFSMPKLHDLRVKLSTRIASDTAHCDCTYVPLCSTFTSQLVFLDLALADDTTFTGLQLPLLLELELSGDRVAITDISSLLATCPKLEALELRHCQRLEVADVKSLPALHYLVLHNLPELSEQACDNLLGALHNSTASSTSNCLTTLEISDCARITELAFATIVSFGLQPSKKLTFKLLPPNRFSTLVTPMFDVLITALQVTSIHVSELPAEVKKELLKKYATRLRRKTRALAHSFLDFSVDGVSLTSPA